MDSINFLDFFLIIIITTIFSTLITATTFKYFIKASKKEFDILKENIEKKITDNNKIYERYFDRNIGEIEKNALKIRDIQLEYNSMTTKSVEELEISLGNIQNDFNMLDNKIKNEIEKNELKNKDIQLEYDNITTKSIENLKNEIKILDDKFNEVFKELKDKKSPVQEKTQQRKKTKNINLNQSKEIDPFLEQYAASLAMSKPKKKLKNNVF